MTKFSKLFFLEYCKCPVYVDKSNGFVINIAKVYSPNLSVRDVYVIKNCRDFGLYNYFECIMYYILDEKSLKIKWCTSILKRFDITNNVNPQKSICNFIDGVLNDSHKWLEGVDDD